MRGAAIVRAKDRRDLFTDEELAKIFSGFVFTHYGDDPYDAPYRYWAPLIALFTGARLAEIADLHLEDIGNASGVDCIDINLNTEEKRVKTANRIQKVPVHPTLVELGLLRYRDALLAQRETRLFPELKTYSEGEGYRRNIGDWFNRKYLPERGVYRKC